MQQQLHKKAQDAINLRQFDVAQKALIQLLNGAPKFADGYFLLGIIEAELGSYTKAVALINKASVLQPSAEYFAHLAKCQAMIGDSNQTYSAIRQAQQFNIEDALTLDTIGVALSRLGDHHTAIEYFNMAIAQKSFAPFYYNLGSSQTFAGHFDEARASYEQAILLEPLFYQAHSSLSHLGGVDKCNNHIARLRTVMGKLTDVNAKLHIAHALSRELDAIGEYEAAFAELHQAKSVKSATLNYDFADDLALFKMLKQCFSDELVNKIKSANKQSLEALDADTFSPIFVTGMPRSGTTLVERVLTNHKHVKSAGELQEFAIAIKRVARTRSQYILDPETILSASKSDLSMIGRLYQEGVKNIVKDANQFVDKMPLNVLNAGFIIGALPTAKIICVIRNPMDTVWGNYKQLFSLTDSYYNYSFQQTHVAQYYCEFVKLAAFWQEKFPEQFKIVSYDEFVTAPDIISKEFVTFCGLEFDTKMLDITSNTSAVATASSVQVRTGINTKSLGQWKKYQAYLQPAIDELQRQRVVID